MTLQRFVTHSWLLSVLLFLLAGPGLIGPAAAQEGREVVGKVIIATAGSLARDAAGEERRLRRRSKLYAGDTVVTGVKGRVQIRFSDGSLLGLKPNTEFLIEQYHYAGEADGSESAVYKLLKGGMRTITGAIGKTRKENYKVETDAATIGIRGTHYLLQVCSTGCGDQQAKGVFGGVVNGAIAVRNDAGETTFGRDQYFQVPSADAAPKQLLRPPEFLTDTAPIEESGDERQEDDGDAADGDGETDDGEDGGESSADSGAESGGDDTASDSETAVVTSEYQSTDEVTASGETTATSEATTTRTKLPDGGALGLTFIEHDDIDGFEGEGGVLFSGQVTAYVDTVDGADNIPVAIEVWFRPEPNDPDDNGCQPCIIEIDTDSGQLLDAGGNTDLGVNWGRWQGSFSLEENGRLLETAGSSHFIYSPNVTPLSTVQSLTGRFYYLGHEATPPTDQNGNTGILESAYLDVDFDLQRLDNAGLYVSFPDQSRDYALAMDTHDQPFPLEELYSKDPPSDIRLIGGCTGSGCGEATAEGHMGAAFIGPNAEGAIGTYGFREGINGDGSISDHGVTGTVLFERQPGM